MQDQELLTLDTIAPIWAKRLEESELLPILSLRRLRLYLELDTSKCVVGEAYGFSHLIYLAVSGVLKLVGSLCFIL